MQKSISISRSDSIGEVVPLEGRLVDPVISQSLAVSDVVAFFLGSGGWGGFLQELCLTYLDQLPWVTFNLRWKG